MACKMQEVHNAEDSQALETYWSWQMCPVQFPTITGVEGMQLSVIVWGHEHKVQIAMEIPRCLNARMMRRFDKEDPGTKKS